MDNEQRYARRRLDARLERIRPLAAERRPHKGWVRAIRDALGMSSTELASRIGVSQQMVSELEGSEVRDSVKLATLRRAADALDCDLVYFLVPRTTLDDAVMRQATRKASEHLGPIAHHSRLEDQSLSSDDTRAQIEELASQFVDRRGLWTQAESAR